MKKLFCILGIMCSIWVVSPAVFAAEPSFIVSWESGGYVPSWYEGKAIPAPNSRVVISFELVNQGKILDLSGSEVRWYFNDEFVKKGFDLKSASLKMPPSVLADSDVKISVIWKDPNTGKSTVLNNYSSLPLQNPEVVLSRKSFVAPLPQSTLSFGAYPFFFSAPLEQLNIEWMVNGKGVETNGATQDLNIKTSEGYTQEIRVTASVENMQKSLERVSRTMVIGN